MPHSPKRAGHDPWELRVRFAADICRLFYFHHRGAVYLVTSGYVKKTDRTSPTEITRAARLKQLFLSQEET